MSQGNSNQHMRRRLLEMRASLAIAHQALHAAAPVTNALFEYFKANEACQPNPFEGLSPAVLTQQAEAFLKARTNVLKILESVNMGLSKGVVIEGDSNADV